MKRLIIPVVIILTALIVSGGFFMPALVSQFKDQQTIGMMMITDGSGVSFETKSELQIVDRLRMVTNAGRIELDKGKNMDAAKAYQSALTELGKINSNKIMDFDMTTCTMSKSSVAFYIDSADPTKNLIVWNLLIEDKTHYIWVAVDDETGILLSLQYNINSMAYKYDAPSITRQNQALPFNIEQITQSIADYYGLTVVNSEPIKSDKYIHLTLEFHDGEKSIALTVGITYGGFFVNI